MNRNLIVMVLLYILMDIFLFYIMHMMNFSVWFIALVLILFNLPLIMYSQIRGE